MIGHSRRFAELLAERFNPSWLASSASCVTCSESGLLSRVFVAISAPPFDPRRGTPSMSRDRATGSSGSLSRDVLVVRLAFWSSGSSASLSSCSSYSSSALRFGCSLALRTRLRAPRIRRIVCGLIGSRLSCLPVWRTFLRFWLRSARLWLRLSMREATIDVAAVLPTLISLPPTSFVIVPTTGATGKAILDHAGGSAPEFGAGHRRTDQHCESQLLEPSQCIAGCDGSCYA